MYQQVADDIAAKLTELQANYGFQADFPDMPIRQRLMQPVFGLSDGHGSGNDDSAFQTYRLPVRAAARAFAENAQTTGFPMLRERVKNELVAFKTEMVNLQGASLSQTDSRMAFIFDIAQTILKAVSAVFGVSASLNPDWPLNNTDPHGAQLIENITTQLPGLPYGVIPLAKFVEVERIAEKGFQSIRIILDSNIEDPNFDIDPLITELYAWDSLIGGARPQQQPPPIQPPVNFAGPVSSTALPRAVASVRPANIYRS
jgi:hypothetical protein